MAEISSAYHMRGARVQALNSEDIGSVASEAAKLLKINKYTIKQMDVFMEQLQERGILIDIVDDPEWLCVTNAGCVNNIILIPGNLYDRICDGEHEAVFIFFHELGHLLLAHKAMLHHSDTEPTKNEDSEWQADEFSKKIMEIMKIKYIPEQLCLKF